MNLIYILQKKDKQQDINFKERQEGDQNVSVHPSFLPHYWALLTAWQPTARTRVTLTPAVIPNSNYVIMVSD
jgi:hypothetical protein